MSVAVLDRHGTGSGPPTEAFLLAHARAGDTTAQEELAARCRRTAYVIALQLLGSREDAMDLAQDAVVRLLLSLGRLDVTRPVRPWLAKIVVNLVRDARRRRQLRRAGSLDECVRSRGQELVDPGASPEETAEREEVRRHVAMAVGRLSASLREILVLRDYQGLSYAEIAAALSIPVGTVMSRLHRARTLLREALGGLDGRQP